MNSTSDNGFANDTKNESVEVDEGVEEELGIGRGEKSAIKATTWCWVAGWRKEVRVQRQRRE